MKTQNNAKKQFFADAIESSGENVGKQISSLSKDTIRAMWEDFFKASVKKNVPEQIKGSSVEKKTIPQEAVLQEGQEFSLISQKTEKKTVITPEHREYFQRDILSVEMRKEKQKSYENSEQIAMVKTEIRKLIKAQKEMAIAFKDASDQVLITSTPENAGTYDVHFFEWVLLTIKNARMRVEEGKNWLALFASKKGQQKYWAQAQKKGTSFTQHHDRAVATQTG